MKGATVPEATSNNIAGNIRKTRRKFEKELLDASPVYRNHVDMIRRVYGQEQVKGGLTQTERILIAFGLAIHSGTESSVDWTLSRARNHGATEQMIREAIDVALLTGGGLAVANARFAFGLLRIAPEKS
jgi:alkylhydroperoxidase/carboxymuconolactone decarboxylase family protein YurZ